MNSGNSYAGQTVMLANSITLTSPWTPIGEGTRSGSGYSGKSFKGTFNGMGFTISGLTGTTLDSSYVFGLFGIVDGGTVTNVKLSNVSINAEKCKNVGAAIGLMVNNATASYIEVLSGSISAPDGVGGVVGRMTIEGTIDNCKNNASVTGGASGGVGGIVGKAYYTAVNKEMNITNCQNTGKISGDYAGGIVGFATANVKDCSNSAEIEGKQRGGGIIAEHRAFGLVSGNVNSGNIAGAGNVQGGIIGWLRYADLTDADYQRIEQIIVRDNTNSGNITAESGHGGAGGIIGLLYNSAIVSGNINTAQSIVSASSSAGIVGGMQMMDGNRFYPNGTATVENNISTTPLENIECGDQNKIWRDLYAYNNDKNAFAVVRNNTNILSNKIEFENLPDDVQIEVTDPTGKVFAPQADGSYNLQNGRYFYSAKVGEGISRGEFTVDGKNLTVKAAEPVYLVSFDVTPAGTVVIVTDEKGNVMRPESGNTYMLEAGNYIAVAKNSMKSVEMQFIVDSEPIELEMDATFVMPDVPRTGDSSNLVMWMMLATITVLLNRKMLMKREM